MFGIGIPEVIIIFIVMAFIIFGVAIAIVISIYLLKKFGVINPANRNDMFCPKCGAKLEA